MAPWLISTGRICCDAAIMLQCTNNMLYYAQVHIKAGRADRPKRKDDRYEQDKQQDRKYRIPHL